MSQEHVEIVRRALRPLERGRRGLACVTLYDPAITFTTRGEVVLGRRTMLGPVRGLERAMEAFAEVWESIDPQVLEFFEGSEAVVAVTSDSSFGARGRRPGP